MFATNVVLSARRWFLAALVVAVASLPSTAKTQDYNQQPYPPQQGNYDPQQQGDPSQADPPSRVARVSMTQGNVSLQPAGVEDFSAASLNYPLTSGDRLYSDNGSLAELEAGQLAIRLGGATDLSVTSMTDQIAQFGLGQGSVHVRSYDFDPSSTLEIDTPNVAVTVLAPGDLRVDVSPDGNMTQVTLISGQARVDGQGFQQQLQPGESLQLTGSEPVYAQDVRRPRSDGLDRFSSDRDRTYESAVTMTNDYVNPSTIGAADLGQYGDWSNDADSGPVWYPRGVAVDWQPYSVGRWAYVAPWGWTWVENEPWGFAPFHYGRWARFGPRWGWIPGPRVVRPVYSPALVAFVGGGAGVTAWFPLGPREPYTPWYRTSALYANRVNVTNIYSRNAGEVRNIYNQRTTNVYINNRTVNNRVYVNRQVATVAIPQNAFAGGRPVREVSLHGAPQQFANAPVLQRPMVTPTRSIMAPAPARALPPRINRPPVESRAPINAGGQPGGWNRPGGNGNPGGWNNGAGRTGGDRPGGFNNGGVRPGGDRPGGDRPGGDRPGTDRPVGFGSQPGNTTGNFPSRGGNSPLPNQPPMQMDPGRGNQPGNSGQFPNRGDGRRQAPPLQSEPGRGTGTQPVGPAQVNPFPGRADGDQRRGDPGRVVSPSPITTQPGSGQPGASQPGSPQFPNRGNGPGQAPSFRGDPSRTPGTVPTQPQPVQQFPNRGNGEGQAPPLRGGPGRTIVPTPIPQPVTPVQNNPVQGPRDFRNQPGGVSGQPQPPANGGRQWQPPAQVQPQNHIQPPPQPQREMRPPQPAPQPQQAPRQFIPPPARTAPPAVPNNVRPAHEEKK